MLKLNNEITCFICPFARACWHGSTLSIHTSEFTNLSVQQWIKQLISRFTRNGVDSMCYMQDVFTILWALWTHRNKVIHQGINPNPVDVILTAQHLSCRYRETISNRNSPGGREGSGIRSGRDSTSEQIRTGRQSVSGDWQIIIKLVDSRSRKLHRYGTAYEALTVQGEKVFFGAISSNAQTSTGALLEAMLEAVLTAKGQGFQQILVLSNSRSLLQTYKNNTASDWLDSTKLADLWFLNQNGVSCDVFWVPAVVVKDLRTVAGLATHVPMHFCWIPSVGSNLL